MTDMDRADALRVMQLFLNAYPDYPLTADGVELYVATMTTRTPDAATAYAVAVDWTNDVSNPFGLSHFPKIAEFITAYGVESGRREKAARRRVAAQQHYRPGTVACSTCADSGMEQWTDGEGNDWTAPCSQCRPAERSYWREGHYDVGHDVRGCEHPRCEERSRGRRKAKT